MSIQKVYKKINNNNDNNNNNNNNILNGQLFSEYITQPIIFLQFQNKNPACGRQRISQPMWIVGLIQFWRGCVIYLKKREKIQSGMTPRF